MFIIYSKQDCIWCERAKALLTSLGEPFQEFRIDLDAESKAELKERLNEEDVEPPYTVPQIWTENEYVGGFTELNGKYNEL